MVLLGPDCPVSTEAVPELNRLAQLARDSSVEFYGLISDPFALPAEAEELRQRCELGFPILFDANGVLANRLQPCATPEAFLYDEHGERVYRGRIDDRSGSRFSTNAPARRDLSEALQALASGRAHEVRQTKAVGCAFEGWDELAMDRLTWAENVAPIIDLHCVECHGPSGPAPFPLIQYEDVVRRSKMIARVAVERTMPRWHAVPSLGMLCKERILDPREIRTLELWSLGGARRGDDSRRLPARLEAPSPLGPPDLVLALADEIVVPAEGRDLQRIFTLPPAVTERAWLRAVGFHFSDSRAIRRAVLLQGPREASDRVNDDRRDAEASVFPPYSSVLAQWLPGRAADALPSGVGRALTDPGTLALWVHLHPTGARERLNAVVELWFDDGPIVASVEYDQIGSTGATGSRDVHGEYLLTAEKEATAGTRLLAVIPCMNRAGERMSVSARFTDGSELPIVTLSRWDSTWPDRYRLCPPLDLPPSTALVLKAHFHDGPPETSLAPPPLELYPSDDAGPARCYLELAVPLSARVTEAGSSREERPR